MPNCCHRRTFTLSGVVTSTITGPVSGFPIAFTVDCATNTTTTDAAGRFTIIVPECSCVEIVPQIGVGVNISPVNYQICPVCFDRTDLNFTLTPVTPGFVTVSGFVSGLPNNVGIQVNYSVGGQVGSAMTDALGQFSFNALPGSNVLVAPTAQAGFAVTPTFYQINNIAANTPNQNFVYTPNV